MKKRYALLITGLLLLGAGCAANSNVDVNDGAAGVDVKGGIDLNEGSNGY